MHIALDILYTHDPVECADGIRLISCEKMRRKYRKWFFSSEPRFSKTSNLKIFRVKTFCPIFSFHFFSKGITSLLFGQIAYYVRSYVHSPDLHQQISHKYINIHSLWFDEFISFIREIFNTLYPVTRGFIISDRISYWINIRDADYGSNSTKENCNCTYSEFNSKLQGYRISIMDIKLLRINCI